MATGSVNYKRTFKEIRKTLLLSLSEGQRTINEISTSSHINWKTVDNHLIHLAGRGLVKEVLNSSYVRIYELTPEGKDFIMCNVSNKIKIKDNKKNAIIKTTNIIVL
ncbi:ArsR family transcriptional regulator [Candidatus Woesearchaeota archaeon]|nr:ArsR family transcriptional regulator [Candidatus Woesearchaeota archaeon]